MKKQINSSLFFILAILFGSAALHADTVARQAEVTSLSGQVEWLKAGEADWKPATLNQKLDNGDKVRTGTPGEATLTLDEGSTLELFGGSEFTVQSLLKDSASNKLDSVLAIMKGKLRAHVTHLNPGSSFKVETPLMSAVVRGTIFTLTVNPDGSVTAECSEGTVDLIKEGDNKFLVQTDQGDQALFEFDPTTNTFKITSLTGDFDVTGPDGTVTHLKQGETIVINAGAATFVPVGGGPGGATPPPAGEGFNEATTDGSTGDNDTPLDVPISGS